MWFLLQQCLDPFLMDICCPFSMKHVGSRQFKQKIANGRGIQHIGIQQGGIVSHS